MIYVFSVTESEPNSPRKNYLEWDEYFMAVSFLSAQRSKDPATQVRLKTYLI